MANTTTLWVLLLLQCGAVLATYYHRSSSESSSSSRGYRLPTAASSYKSKNSYYQQQAPLRQAAVDVVSKSRMNHNYNDNKLSPLEVLYNKLDSQSQSSSSSKQEFSQKHTSYFSNNGKRDYVPSPMLRSAPEHRRHALQLKNDDTYDYVEEDEDVDDNEDDEDEDEEDEEEEEGEDTDVEGDHHPLRHQKHNHHSESVKIWDGEGFQDQQPSSGQSYSEFKWHIFGKENINNYRNRHRPPNRTPTPENIKRAVDHTLVMNREGACRVPKPKVVHVKAVYPHPGKAYIPHCTILHQCGDDTGCCRSETQTCTARTTQPVELFFYTQKVGSSGGSSVTNVEKLIFYNHTECSCVDRLEEVMPRDGGNSHHHHNHQSNTKPSPDPAQICRCPRMFSERQLADGTCTCECFDKQRECIRAKRGKEYLSLQDQMCVVNGHCQPPSCEFGTYKRHAGRCPRKEEKFDVWRAYPHRDEDFK